MIKLVYVTLVMSYSLVIWSIIQIIRNAFLRRYVPQLNVDVIMYPCPHLNSGLPNIFLLKEPMALLAYHKTMA